MKTSLANPLRAAARSSHAGKWLACAVIVAGMLGCRGNSSQREIFIRELRQQEDQIYQLEDYLAEYQQLIRQKRAENAKLRHELDELKQKSADGSGNEELPFGGAGSGAPTPAPTDGDDDGAGTGLPEIDLGDPVLPDIDLGEPVPAEDVGAPPALPLETQGALPLPGGEQLASATVSTDVFVPPPMPIDRANSVALYAEQAPTESSGDVKVGLLAIVEPLCEDGSAGAFRGPLSLMVLDPIAGEDAPPLARWDLTDEQVEQAWRDGSRRVLDFALALPDDAPVGRPLELWVRMLPAEGEKILSHTAIELATPVNIVGPAASGLPRRLAPDELTAQTSWVAAEPVGVDEPAVDVPDWRAASQTPPAALASPQLPLPRPAAPPTIPTWSPTR